MAHPQSDLLLNARPGSSPEIPAVEYVATDEAAVCPSPGASLHVTPLVKEGDRVAKGAVVARLRHAPDVCFVAPLAGSVARISLQPGRKLSEIVLFREPGEDTVRHDPGIAETSAGLRKLMQAAGVWPWLRRRPFGGMPAHDERPAAILVMAADTRHLAPDPRHALNGREADFDRGLEALERLTNGPVMVCQQEGAGQVVHSTGKGRIRTVGCGPRHPQGSAGLCIHRLFPAGLDAPVWDMHAEDTAALGALLKTGVLPMNRLVHVAGQALRQAKTILTHPGADLGQLTQRIAAPGPHVLLSGSALDGHAARWLAPRDRQVTALPRGAGRPQPHWLIAALTRSATAAPAIPTAALTQAFGSALPALPFLRALGAGDEETAMKLGVLSLLEEDVALAGYALSDTDAIKTQLRAMLDRIQAEYAA